MTRITCLTMATLALMASAAHARLINWQAELDRCRALRENMAPLLLAGEGTSGVARSGAVARCCVWIERRAARKNISGGDSR